MPKYPIAMFFLVFSNFSYCCSLSPDELFRPDERYVTPADTVTFAPILIPKPIVNVIYVHRGHSVESGGPSCGDIGGAMLKIAFPADSKHDIKEYGFYVQIIEGDAPFAGARRFPIKLKNVRENTGEYYISWVEHFPKPFEAKMAVNAVSKKDMEISVPTVFTIKHDGR